jgi:hypothetical protein
VIHTDTIGNIACDYDNDLEGVAIDSFGRDRAIREDRLFAIEIKIELLMRGTAVR